MAFGFAGGVVGIDANAAAAAYLEQSMAGLISACQRLLPLGQSRAAGLLWQLKPGILETACAASLPEGTPAFTPMVDLGSLRHVALRTRLFIS
jgi:urease accessory protein